MRKLFLLSLFIFSLSSMVQTIYYVKIGGSNASDGKSWATAFETITKAIDIASNSDEIRVGQGAFNSTSTYFIQKSLTIKGGFGQDGLQDYSSKTMLDGVSATRIMLIKNTTSGNIPNVKLDGFIFRNANATGFGSAIAFDNATGTVSNCEFANNSTPLFGGGGLSFRNSSTINSVVNCSFTGNTAQSGGAIYSGAGTLVEVVNCTISDNACSTGVGGGINSNGTLSLKNSIVWGNKKGIKSNQIHAVGTLNLDHNILQDDSGEEDIVAVGFVGVGAQIGGYDNIQQITGSTTFSNADWEQMFSRLRFMRPGLVRIMGSQSNYYSNGVYNPEKSKEVLLKILDFCQTNNISVIWGEWGHVGVNSIDMDWLNRSVDFLSYLVNTKAYNCVKYFNMVNEPNGNWSSVGGNFTLWENLILKTRELMLQKGLQTKVQLMAPDAALSSGAFTGITPITHPFVTNTVNELDSVIGTYDYHFYPANDQVENNKYLISAQAYKNLFPSNKDAIIAELGFKYLTSSPKGILNDSLKNADPYADVSACEMVYESVYGIDISAAIIQALMCGYKGTLVWRLDDAMYISTASGIKTNRWGFWNSLGTEIFGNPDDEKLRPWFFPTSLLSRYFPAGCTILNVVIPVKAGLYAIAGKKDDKYTIALVNTNSQNYKFDLKMNGGKQFNNMNFYKYVALSRKNFIWEIDTNGFPKSIQTQNLDLSRSKSISITMEGSSFLLLTNMN